MCQSPAIKCHGDGVEWGRCMAASVLLLVHRLAFNGRFPWWGSHDFQLTFLVLTPPC